MIFEPVCDIETIQCHVYAQPIKPCHQREFDFESLSQMNQHIKHLLIQKFLCMVSKMYILDFLISV